MESKTLTWLWLPAHAKVEVGQILTAAELECVSPRALDALQRSPGTTICRIDSSGTVLAMADATKTLHEFACWSAEQALLQAGHEPDPRSWAAIEIKRKWLKGEATDEELDMARNAAWNAVEDAARYAFRAASAAAEAAWCAAGTSATIATWSVARLAAWNAAWSAVWNAAWSTDWDVTNSRTRYAILDAAWNAAWTATWDASRGATRAAQNAKLEELLIDLLEESEEKGR